MQKKNFNKKFSTYSKYKIELFFLKKFKYKIYLIANIFLFVFFFHFLVGQKVFGQFLKGEFSDENILFWQACEELKHEVDEEKITEKVTVINSFIILVLR